MRNIEISLAFAAVAFLGMVDNAKGSANDRYYTVAISPPVTTPVTTTNFKLTVTNDLKSGPLHPIRQIVITVPAAFVLTQLPGGSPPVTAPPHFSVSSIAGQVITLIATNSYGLPAGSPAVI